jgi:[ribosomal protein S18]-alanine N-acetyltransferase
LLTIAKLPTDSSCWQLGSSRNSNRRSLLFRLRPYLHSDFELLYKLDQQCFASDIAYSRAELSSYVERKNSFTLVAEDTEGQTTAEKIAGFITVEITREGYGHIITIDAHPKHRRKGLGTLLLQGAEKKIKALEGFMVALEVAVDNTAAITFYKRHKFNVLKTLPRYYNGKVDGLLMTKRL